MKICVFGAGAIGGYMAGELALAGPRSVCNARGAHLAAIQSPRAQADRGRTGRARQICRQATTPRRLARRTS